jgi:hypothetical protein
VRFFSQRTVLRDKLGDCSGSKADVTLSNSDVRFTPESRHWLRDLGCPLCANRRLRCSINQNTLPGIQITGRKPHPSTGLDGRIDFKNEAIGERSDLPHHRSVQSIYAVVGEAHNPPQPMRR